MKTLLVVAALVCAAPAAATEVLQADTKSYPVSPGQRVRIVFPVGRLQIEASDGDKVRFTLLVKCKGSGHADCAEWASKLRLDATNDSRELEIKVDKYPKWKSDKYHVEGVLQVPRDMALTVEMGVGELDIDGMRGELDVELGVGEADLRVPRSAIRNVSVEVGVGDGSVQAPGGNVSNRGWLLGREVTWNNGTGLSRVRLEVGVGEGTVRVD